MNFCMAVLKKPATASGEDIDAYAAMASPSGPRCSVGAAMKDEHSSGSHDIDSCRRAFTFLQNIETTDMSTGRETTTGSL